MKSGTAQLQLPNFLIIGVMKGGSTSLARYLGEHPQIFLAPEKEVHYFDRHFDRGVDWYASRFNPTAQQRAVGEATPSYFYSPEVIDRLAATLPEAKLIAILRDPVERAYSHFWHERARGREHLDFEEALDAEADRLENDDSESRIHYSYVDQGRYVSHLERVAERFPREHIQVLFSEELEQDAPRTVLSACRFLGVDLLVPDNIGTRYNQHVSFRSLRMRAVAQSLSKSGPAFRFMGRVVGRLNTRRRAYIPMNPELRMRLAEEFAADNRRLAEWLGRDLPGWTRPR